MNDPDLTSLFHPDATRWRDITAGSGAMMRETYATAEQLGEALKVTEKTLDAISDAENLRREVAELGRKATTDYLDLRGSIRTLGWVAAVELFLLVAVVCALVGVAAR